MWSCGKIRPPMKNTSPISFAWAVRFFVVVGLCLDFTAHAAFFLQEGFNYPAGILGNNSPWTGVTGLIVATNTSLAYSNLADFSPPALCTAVAQGSTAVSYRPLDTTANSAVVYFSCLINFTLKPGSYYIAGLLQSTNAPPGGTSADPLDLVDNTSGSGYKLGVRAKGGTTTYVANALVPMSTNTTYFLVMKYNFTNGLASLYLNPPPGVAEPVAPDASSTAAAPVPDLKYVYLRSGSSTAGNFLISALRVGSTWAEVTPSTGAQIGRLLFSAQPAATTAGNFLPAVTVQLQDALGNNLASNNVPVSLSVNGGVFASGTATANTSPTGLAGFNNLVVNAAGNYTLTASATGFNSVVSSNFTINPAAIHHYSISAASSAFAGESFAVTGSALDVFSNAVTTDNSTLVTLSSTTGNVVFDANDNGVFAESGDNVIALSNGTFSLNARDNVVQTVSLTATDTLGKTGGSGLITVISNGITANGAMLNAFLDSMQVDKFWLGGTSVNWLTGVPGGTGANMTSGSATHCSVFAPSAAELLGVYLLRPPDASDLDLANHQADWFVTNTAGWFPIAAMTNAQHMVNTGLLVMASYKASGGSGHIAVLRASNRTDAEVTATGPEECQSGTFNFADTNIVTGFDQHAGAFPSGIKYYGHTVNYPISPVWPLLGQSSISNQSFKAGMTTIVGRKYQIQWSSNLVNWSSLVNFTNSNKPVTFFTNSSFSDSISAAQKFYRILPQ
jgi:hypothetical protein